MLAGYPRIYNKPGVWQYVFLIAVLRRLRPEDHKVSVCMDFITRFCLCSREGSGNNKKKKNEWIYVKNLILLRQVCPCV